MTDISIAADPFSTAFERFHPHEAFTARDEEWTQPRHRPAVAFDRVRFEADGDRFRWNQMILRQMSNTRITYTERDGWFMVPFTDQEKSAERARFQVGRA